MELFAIKIRTRWCHLVLRNVVLKFDAILCCTMWFLISAVDNVSSTFPPFYVFSSATESLKMCHASLFSIFFLILQCFGIGKKQVLDMLPVVCGTTVCRGQGGLRTKYDVMMFHLLFLECFLVCTLVPHVLFTFVISSCFIISSSNKVWSSLSLSLSILWQSSSFSQATPSTPRILNWPYNKSHKAPLINWMIESMGSCFLSGLMFCHTGYALTCSGQETGSL